MKRYFLTGLVIILPVILTFLVIIFIFNLLTVPFLSFTKNFFDKYDIFETEFLFLTAEHFQTFMSQVFIFIGIILFTIFLGAITRWLFFSYIIAFWEYILTRVPLVSGIYKAAKDVVDTLFTSSNNAFKQVVLVQFPNQDTFTIGLMTRNILPGLEPHLNEDSVVVFVPTTPNPTSGFLVIFDKENVIPLDMSVENAFKYIISCGVVIQPLKREVSE